MNFHETVHDKRFSEKSSHLRLDALSDRVSVKESRLKFPLEHENIFFERAVHENIDCIAT